MAKAKPSTGKNAVPQHAFKPVKPMRTGAAKYPKPKTNFKN